MSDLTFQPVIARLKLKSNLVNSQSILIAKLRLKNINLIINLIDYQIISASQSYFNEAISQDANNIYIGKKKLPDFIPTTQNSLESMIAALIIHRLNAVFDVNSKIKTEVFNQYFDPETNQIVTIITETYYQKATVVDSYEVTDAMEFNPNKI